MGYKIRQQRMKTLQEMVAAGKTKEDVIHYLVFDECLSFKTTGEYIRIFFPEK